MSESDNRINPGVARITPYKPGKPVDELTRELGITDVVKLASNENPRGPGTAVLKAIQSATAELSRYPDGGAFRLKAALADRLGVAVDRLTVGNGSNDVLDLVARMALVPGAEVIVADHSFVVYRLATLACGGELVSVPARQYGADLPAMARAVTDATRIVFIANPNNPTGTYVGKAALEQFLDAVPSRVWVVLDEAYFEYVTVSDYPDATKWLGKYPNLIVTRTFSKIYGLAALRVGYGVSSPEVADLLNRARQPFNANSLALVAAEAALGDEAFVRDCREQNLAGKTLVEEAVTAMGLSFIEGVGNFVPVDVGTEAQPVFDALLHEGVIVRPVAEYGLPHHLRITIGSLEENQRGMAALAKVLGR